MNLLKNAFIFQFGAIIAKCFFFFILDRLCVTTAAGFLPSTTFALAPKEATCANSSSLLFRLARSQISSRFLCCVSWSAYSRPSPALAPVIMLIRFIQIVYPGNVKMAIDNEMTKFADKIL